ncbi:hypothetical protein [Aeromicrobium sp. CnD17-E]|uniref:hypothetical protein n=1 Tax=Aeromicrobium sp. CnD17-E TaxID=2954487 RepID=UPI0020974EE7|nr:hypothetical protein [Aeromicrobium sp. CnD17-E]MCO7240876.1 hypothetical protein [Aeromicrobium sp. CnD17-E]
MRWRKVLATVAVAAVGTGLLTSAGVQAQGDDVGAFRQTKTVERTFTENGDEVRVDRRDVTVQVDHTRNLRGRERVHVTWDGARPSGGRSTSPFGENGMDQEYPVVVLQCRGRDDASLPAAQRVRPETCWTSTVQQRSQLQVPDAAAIWRSDRYADDAARSALSGVRSLPASCGGAAAGTSTHVTPFVSAKGQTFASCSSDTLPPEAAVDASFPPAEQAAFTTVDGKGDIQFEVRSSIENESLGCNDTTACSIVVIPVMGISCLQSDSRQLNAACRKQGRFEPGSSNFDGQGVDESVSPRYWWTASNWRNRISVPITFGPAPNVCSVLDDRPPVGFYGSELMSQATVQWAPAYCLRKDRFRFQHNVLPDLASFQLMQQDEIPGAFVSSRKTVEGEAPTAYAPTAVTGFAISYVIDEPKNAGERGTLNLNARLLAKLLTQSYPGSSLGRQHPGLENNPGSLNADPEFQALNPGLSTGEQEAAAVLVSLSESSDVIKAISTYIDDDPEAHAFVEGRPDPWGMRINPAYQGIRLPVDEWPLLDTFTPTVQQECLKQNNDTPYLTRLAAPVTSFVKIADALLDAWPYSQTKCSGLGTDQFPYVLGRADRQGVGARFLVGVTTLGDAERYGLHTAALQTSAVSPRAPFTTRGRQFVAPTDATLAKAISTARPTGRTQPFALEDGAVRQANGYPGTLVVYTAAKTSGLDRSTARTVASFIRTATTEGQRRGSGNGFLPDGYLPITRTGTTAALFASAQQAAQDVEAQTGTTPGGPGGAGSGGTADPTSGAPGSDGAPSDAAAAGDDPAAAGGKQPVDAELKSLGSTAGVHSALGAWFLPTLILLLLGCAIAGPVIRLRAAGREDS